MTSMVSTAVAAIVAALESGTPVSSQISRVRLRAIAKEQATAVVVRPLQAEVAQASDLSSYPVSWTSTVAVECYARCGANTAPDVAVDALVESVFARLMADTTLGGAVLAMQPKGISWDFDADGDQTTCATLVFNARHRTQGASLT